MHGTQDWGKAEDNSNRGLFPPLASRTFRLGFPPTSLVALSASSLVPPHPLTLGSWASSLLCLSSLPSQVFSNLCDHDNVMYQHKPQDSGSNN